MIHLEIKPNAENATLAPWPTALGLILTYTGKLWFLDRMVWLYRETALQNRTGL
ncbi:MAG: hypothetical protein Fur0032_10390 [Terrimicrobiaceae bacterium]